MYVLTRTSGRPKLFGNLRRDLLAQTYPRIVHVVHSDDPADQYIEADLIVRGPRLPITKRDWGPDIYNRRLIDALEGLEPGWVLMIDDDDTLTSETSVADAMSAAHEAGEDHLVIWKNQRANALKPRVWVPDSLQKRRGRLQWSNGTFHTKHLKTASACFQSDHPVQKPFLNRSYDALFWLRMHHALPIHWHDAVLCRQQIAGIAGKGYGRREDV